MATITKQTIRVDLTPGRVYPVLHVSQGDVGLEVLKFYIYQNGQPFSIPSEVTAINIDGMTPVGVFSYPCTWTGNMVTAGLTATMTAERGIDICELALYDATHNKIGTCNFVIAVEESPYTNAHVSTSDMATIMAAASSAQQYELLSKSWAVGDTGIRTGEDTNNSEYWSEISESWAVGGTGKRTGEDTNNSEYWAGMAQEYAASASFKTFSTVSAMISDTSLLDGSVCRTLGYYSANDGGGALYKIRAAAPTSYYETLANGLYAELVFGDFVNVHMFGAHGDGTTDDTAAWKNAINTGKNVKARSLTYAITAVNDDGHGNNPVFALKSGQTIDLNGAVLVVTDKTANASRIFNGVQIKDVVIKNGTMIGDRSSAELTTEFHHAINFWSCSNITIENMVIKDFHGDGIVLNEYEAVLTPCDNVLIQNCLIDNSYRNGISLIYATNTTIIGCTISNTNGTSPMAGLDIEPNRTNQSEVGIHVIGCEFINNTSAGIDFNMEESPAQYEVEVGNCTFKQGNRHFRIRDVVSNATKGFINVHDCVSIDTTGKVVSMSNHDSNNVRITFDNISIDNPNTSNETGLSGSTIAIDSTTTTEGVSFTNIKITNGGSASATLYAIGASGLYSGDLPAGAFVDGSGMMIESETYTTLSASNTIPTASAKMSVRYRLESTATVNPTVTIGTIPANTNIIFENRHATRAITVNGVVIPHNTDAIYCGATGTLLNLPFNKFGYKEVTVPKQGSATIDISSNIISTSFAIAIVTRNANAAMSLLAYSGKHDIVTNTALSIAYDASTHIVTFTNTASVAGTGCVIYPV